MKRLQLATVGLAILLSQAACGGRAAPGAVTPRDRETLTPEEFSERPFYSAYEAIASLRPMWLQLRGPGGVVQVFVDEIPLGGVEVLRTIRLPSIELIKHMDGIQAAARYGRGFEQGAILVTTLHTGR